MSTPRVWVITPMYNEEASFGAYVSAVDKVLIARRRPVQRLDD